ncbi:Ig-like domain-containing protein, partial [Burkholderia multivorans]|uniref:Ig-like domain-containing protein n=1 Tax=Burkholderia multivorans TaxID=87883 RepID=UPI0023AA1E85
MTDDVGSVTGAIVSGGSTDDTTPTLSGTAEAGSTINVYDGTTLLGSTTADASGNWSFTPAGALGEGAHSLTVTATDS